MEAVRGLHVGGASRPAAPPRPGAGRVGRSAGGRARHPATLCRALNSPPRQAPAETAPPPSDDEEGMALPPARGQEQPPQMRVEDLAPEHWQEHLKALKPGQQAALRRYVAAASRINALREGLAALSDEQLAGKTAELRQRLLAWERAGGARAAGLPWPLGRARRPAAPLLGGLPEDVVLEGFAVVREAAHRVLCMRHYDVQLLGGLALHEGQVAEMRTGEGKTLVATLPAYVNALTGRGVHVVTVNPYLARRDAEWIGKVFSFLGLTVGVVEPGSTAAAKAAALDCDVTYLTAQDLAFTYLYDNTATLPGSISIRRPLHYAIVDEVDSILIDEAANPYILSSPDPDAISQAAKFRAAVELVKPLWADVVPEGSDGWLDAEWARFEAGCELALQPKYFQATLTPRGMLAATRSLVAEGHVRLATDGDGRLAVVLVNPRLDGAGRAQLAICRVAVPDGERFAAEAFMGQAEEAWAAGGAVPAAVDAELARRGLTPLPGPPSDAQLHAAVPAALWNGEASWGVFLTLAAKAQHCYHRDTHYLVRNQKVVLVDVPTGRERALSVWQEGLHQAVEAKEGLPVTPEMRVSSTVSYPALFGLYAKLCGMTGTAATEELELSEAYRLDVVRVPPHRPSVRVDHPLSCWYFRQGKMAAVWDLVWDAYCRGQPVLVGTGSVEESESLVAELAQYFSTCDCEPRINLLNARPERTRSEASVVAQAGLPRSVTVATNLAGRGTDILLGGNPKGLVGQLLEARLLGVLAPGAFDLDVCLPPLPLAGLELTFSSEGEMERGLGADLFAAYQAARQSLVDAVAEAGAAGAPLPPWRTAGSRTPAADAAAWLGGVVEAAEVERAHLKLHGAWLHDGSLETVLAEAKRRIRAGRGGGAPPAGAQARAEAHLRRFVLLQWAWFDRRCREYAGWVRAQGGLRIVCAAVPDSRRSEAQLRGRAGRQGDPGDTHLVLSNEDPGLALSNRISSRVILQASGVKEADELPYNHPIFYQQIPNLLAEGIVHSVVTAREDLLRKGREVTRECDVVMETYRSHVYRLRRGILAGGSAAVRDLLHGWFCDAAGALVARFVDASRPPSEWRLQELMGAVHTLVNCEASAEQRRVDFQGRPWQVDAAGEFVTARVNLRPEETAAALRAALLAGGPLPEPPLVPDLAAALGAPGGPPPPSLGLAERRALLALRRRAADAAGGLPPLEAAAARAGRPAPRALRGRHAAAARRLAAWLAELLALQHHNKRLLLKWWWASAAAGGASAAQAEGVVACCERDSLVARLDALWADFLADAGRMQLLASMRSLSSLDPRQEYALESADLFVRLMLDFGKLSTLDIFGGLTVEQMAMASLGDAEAARAEDAAAAGDAGAPAGPVLVRKGEAVRQQYDVDDLARLLLDRPEVAAQLRDAAQAAAAAAGELRAAQAAAAAAAAAAQRCATDSADAAEALEALPLALGERIAALGRRQGELSPRARALCRDAALRLLPVVDDVKVALGAPLDAAQAAADAVKAGADALAAAAAACDAPAASAAAADVQAGAAAAQQAAVELSAWLVKLQAAAARVEAPLAEAEALPPLTAAEQAAEAAQQQHAAQQSQQGQPRQAADGGRPPGGGQPAAAGAQPDAALPSFLVAALDMVEGPLLQVEADLQRWQPEALAPAREPQPQQAAQQQGQRPPAAATDLPGAVLARRGGPSSEGDAPARQQQHDSSALIGAGAHLRAGGGAASGSAAGQQQLERVSAAVRGSRSTADALRALGAEPAPAGDEWQDRDEQS